MAGWADSFPCPTPVVAELGVYRDLAQRREARRSDICSRMLGCLGRHVEVFGSASRALASGLGGFSPVSVGIT